MTTAVNTSINDEIYDPDNPPDDRGMLGRLTVSAYVGGGQVTPSYGAEEDVRIIETVAKYTGNAKVNYEGPVWFLEAEGIDVVRSDGAPFRAHDTIKLKSSDGRNLGKKQTPGQIAQLFNDLGVSASYVKVGEAGSAVGRIFQFKSDDLKLGGGFTKGISLYPVSLMDEDFEFTGEPRVVTPRADRDSDNGAATDGGVSTAPSADESIAILVEILTGKRPEQMMDAIINDGRLNAVDTVFGVPLLDAATDESLVAVLAENHVMTLAASGRLIPFEG